MVMNEKIYMFKKTLFITKNCKYFKEILSSFIIIICPSLRVIVRALFTIKYLLKYERHSAILFPLKQTSAECFDPIWLLSHVLFSTCGRICEMKRRGTVTFEGLVQLVLPEHHPEVMDGAGVELHPEHHVSGRVSVPLVVTLQLQYQSRLMKNQELPFLASMDIFQNKVQATKKIDWGNFWRTKIFDKDEEWGVLIDTKQKYKSKVSGRKSNNPAGFMLKILPRCLPSEAGQVQSWCRYWCCCPLVHCCSNHNDNVSVNGCHCLRNSNTKPHRSGIKVPILYPWRVDWLHRLVDLQERTAACEGERRNWSAFEEKPAKTGRFGSCRCSPPLDSKLGMPCMITWCRNRGLLLIFMCPDRRPLKYLMYLQTKER